MTAIGENFCQLAVEDDGRRARIADVVVGLGSTGLSCARHLHAQGLAVAVTDSRDKPPGLAALRAEFPELLLRVGGFDASLLRDCERLYVSPGVALTEPFVAQARAAGVEIRGDIDLFVAAAQAPLLIVTGSNGKSTVTRMLEHLGTVCGVEVLAGGNLGTPALELLKQPLPDAYALELSSFQLERTARLPARAATVLNVSADHMDRYPDLAAYAAAKGVVYRDCEVAVVNRDDAIASALAPAWAKVSSFGLDAPAENDFGLRSVAGREHLCHGEAALLAVDSLPLVGRHNVANGLAALALGAAAGWPVAQMAEALRSFRGLPHRTELVADRFGVRWINDSKGTNVGATLAAIRGLDGKLVWIAGGLAKDAEFSPLAGALRDRARAAVLIGRDAPQIAAALGDELPVVFAPDLEAAVATAAAFAQPGDNVLFSPACASFDMFADYRERGLQFAQTVRAVCK